MERRVYKTMLRASSFRRKGIASSYKLREKEGVTRNKKLEIRNNDQDTRNRQNSKNNNQATAAFDNAAL
jgi:hypothetical protein